MHDQVQKLPPLLGPLSSFLKEASQENDLSNFFRIVCEEIMPFTFQCSLLESIKNRFETQKKQLLTLISQLERTTKRQVHDSYKKLAACIKDTQIAQKKYVWKCLYKIDRLLNNAIEERYCAPKEYEIAYEYMKDVCCELVEKGYGSLISEFVDISSKDKQIINLEETRRRHQLNLLMDKDMASFTLVQEHYVERTKFAPALNELQDARFLISDLESQVPWVAYNHLYTAHWSWHTSKSYFTDKSLKYETPLNRAKSMLWMEQHSCWCEMQAIKKRNYSEIKKSLFSLDRYKKHLLILENQIALELSIHDPELYQKQAKSDAPYQYCLRVDCTELWFEIEWKKGKKPDCYLIANSQASSTTHQFIELISKAEAGGMIKVPARTVADLMKRSNLSGEIRKIFFGKSSTHEVKFNGPNILGEAANRVDVTQLVKEVTQLHQKYRSPEQLSIPSSEATI
ncbi:MAG TPA: hypothetical protein VGJ00_01590 [Rhabdochlamydiaceae bacterium]